MGESGCGKSTTSRLVTRLDEPTGGTIEFEGRDITHLKEHELRDIRRNVQMIFQDPYSSLNPRQTVGAILSTPLRVHGLHKGKEKARVQELLELVGLNPEHINRYPSEFSGGQRQRIGIARALAVEPKLIIADEPVSALDVSIQAQVMNLLAKLRNELDLAFIFVAHDLGVVRHFCDQVAVMYLGKIVEYGDKKKIYEAPEHPYTQALLSAAPDINVARGIAPKERIRLVGDVPSPIDPPSGCRFRTRCWKAQDICAQQEPPLVSATADAVDADLPRGRRAPAGLPLPGGQDRPRRRGRALGLSRRGARTHDVCRWAGSRTGEPAQRHTRSTVVGRVSRGPLGLNHLGVSVRRRPKDDERGPPGTQADPVRWPAAGEASSPGVSRAPVRRRADPAPPARHHLRRASRRPHRRPQGLIMETAEIRRRWLSYFGSRGHTVVPSAPLVHEDPNLLFVNAGMVPFKPYFLGQETPQFSRATSVQKCVRTLDIEEVGKTTRHGTFFQMNGNFSFGDYFKEGAIELAWELITRSQAEGGLGFEEKDLYASVYHEDDEAIALWKKVAGLSDDRIVRLGRKDNYWNMGVAGPGGPCSEILLDRGREFGACDRVDVRRGGFLCRSGHVHLRAVRLRRRSSNRLGAHAG